MPSTVVIGGGLAGLSAAAALGSAGFQVRLYEARAFPGGRATSFPVSPADEESELIDNCQHVLLRCCINLLDFYQRLGVSHCIRFYQEFYFVEPGGRVSTLRSGRFPAPFHMAESFLRMKCLDLRDKLGIARALADLRRERTRRHDLDRISMLDWLLQKRQSYNAIQRFWGQVLVSAVNEDLGRMAAVHGFQVFWLAFLARADSYQMGVPDVPLRQLYRAESWARLGDVSLHFRLPVGRIQIAGDTACGITASGQHIQADYYVCCLPFERLSIVAPELGIEKTRFEHSPITGIHFWFDRPVTDLPHATLLDRNIQWMFNKSEGRYLQLVASGSRDLAAMSRQDIITIGLSELKEFFPKAEHTNLLKAQVIKELRATYSAAPGTEGLRPGAETPIKNLFLAGDWTRTGWPPTMEGAVRSGYRAAEAVCSAAGRKGNFLLPDIA